MKLMYIALTAVLFSSCSKLIDSDKEASEKYPEYSVFTIKKGKHDTESNTLKFFNGAAVRFSVIFDSSAIYKTLKAENTNDINKLYGFSDCGTQHHVNSARYGWRWNGKSIDILAYTYAHKVRSNKLVGTVKIGEEKTYSITVDKNSYVFELNGNKVVMPRSCDGDIATGYMLYPYFGGDETAPHEVNVYIRELDLITN